MYKFDLNRHYDRPENRLPIQIKHVHSSVSYQHATYQKYDRRGHELPSGYGPSVIPWPFEDYASHNPLKAML